MRGRILIVEDDAEFAGFLSAVFRLDGARVECAADVPTARAYLASSPPPDLVVVDLWLPEVSGLDLLREIAAARPTLPTLVVTAVPGVEDEALAAGARLVLEKPVTAARLRSAARTLLALRGRRHAG